MGLDMTLTRKTFVKEYVDNNWDVRVFYKGKNAKFSDIFTVEELVCDWRKANQIHNWFVQNIQDGNDDCGCYEIGIEMLIELHDICKEVLDKVQLKKGIVVNGYEAKPGEDFTPNYQEGEMIMNPDEIEAILPTTSGCFFGSTDYDQFYLEDVQYTYDRLTKVIEEDEHRRALGIKSFWYTYMSSW